MLSFPEQSVERAREIAARYKRRSKSKPELAAYLYDGKFLHIGYGFNESLKSGNCGRYLHELVKEADCFTMAGALYLIAREAGLQPRIFSAYGIKDVAEGADPNGVAAADHTFITVTTGKNKTHIIDPQMVVYGEATFNPDRNTIKVFNREDRKITHRRYATMRELSEDDYINMLEENRSPKGGRLDLSSTQVVFGAGRRRAYVTYLPKTKQIRSSLHSFTYKFGPEPYNNYSIIDLVSDVANDGSFDFNRGNLLFYYVSSAGWTEHENPQVPLEIKVEEASKFWQVSEAVARKTGRKSPVHGMDFYRFKQMLREAGLTNQSTVIPGSEAEQAVKVEGLEQVLEQVQEIQRKTTLQYIQNVKDDEISYKVLLRLAHYVKASDQAVTDENPDGFVFSEQEHHQLLEDEFEKYKKYMDQAKTAAVEDARVRAGLKKGTKYSSDRAFQREMELWKKRARYFGDMSSAHKSSFPLVFHIVADNYLSERRFDLETLTVEELEQGLEEDDIIRATQRRLFICLTEAQVERAALFLASYKRGLQKILNQEA